MTIVNEDRTTRGEMPRQDPGRLDKLYRLGWSPFFQDQLENIEEDLGPVRVIGVRKNIFLVTGGDGQSNATLAGRLLHGPVVNIPVVGDWVLLRETVITSVFSRRNMLSRRASGGRNSKNSETSHGDQGIAANLDQVFIVCGLDRDFNLRRIERYLEMIYNCNIEPAIILTKADLHENPGTFVAAVEDIAFGVPVYPVSASDSEGLSRLATLLPEGRTVALVGSSGAGKSTLINRLAGREVRTTNTVGSRVKKGRHTTTTRDLIVLPSGGMVIDNPGIREIGLAMDDAKTVSAFPEIMELAQSCRFSDCSHTHEPGCRVQSAVSSGDISPGRLKNYQKIKSELQYYSQREESSAARVEKERWKDVAQKRKSIKKGRKQRE